MSAAPQDVVGFIGTGVMGGSMAGHVLKAGYALRVFNRTRAKAEPLLAAGAAWEPSPAALARACDTVITMVGFPRDVEEVYFGPQGLLAHARPGARLVDMTTSDPALAQRIAAAARERGLHALDAPVSGGDRGAREATLSIMVGGDAADFEAALPLLRCLGPTVVHQGPAGSGQHTKLVNQIAIASGMLAVCEALAYALKAGLNPASVLQSIENGAAGSRLLSTLGPRMLKGDFAPGFYVKHFLKDMGLALDSAARLGLATPGLRLARELYAKLAAQGGAEAGTQALFSLYAGQPPA